MTARRAGDVRLDPTDAAELVELLTFIADWLDGRDAADTTTLTESLTRFVGHPGYDLPTLQADLARFAFLLGDDGERILGE